METVQEPLLIFLEEAILQSPDLGNGRRGHYEMGLATEMTPDSLSQEKAPWVDRACADYPDFRSGVLLLPRLPASSRSPR